MLTPPLMTPEPSDAELVRRIAGAGAISTDAEALLFRRFARRIELYGLRHLGRRDAAEDLVHEVLLRVLQAIRDGRLSEPDRLASFVLGTCRLASFDLRRAERRQRNIERAAGLAAEMLAPVDPPALSEREVLTLFRCLGGLAEREANIVRMTFMEDRAAEEIAERLEMSAGNVRVVRHRALAKLAHCMESGRAP